MKKIINTSGMYQFAFALILLSSVLVSCSKNNDDNGSGSAATTIKMTDAPIDDASVSAVYVTVADIKLDGQSLQGFSKTTINLMGYQNGTAAILGNFNLAGKTYSNISFVLDFDTDMSGNAPGCYVLTATSVKHKLQSSTNIITVTKSFTLENGAQNSLVADFDLRKMIIHQTGGTGGDKYDFATTAELQNDIRIVAENQTGTMNGTLADNISGSVKTVAYAYKKGTFNRSLELSGQGASQVFFSNAVTSNATMGGIIGGSTQYQLHFLEAGDYEVHFAGYKDLNADGELELLGTLEVTAIGGLDLLNLHVGANATITANATVTGITP